MSDDSDGVRSINPIQFFPQGQVSEFALGVQPTPVKEEEPQEKAAPKGSSAPESVSSSTVPVVPESTQTDAPLSSALVPPAPPTPIATADKANGPLKENEPSKPNG